LVQLQLLDNDWWARRISLRGTDLGSYSMKSYVELFGSTIRQPPNNNNNTVEPGYTAGIWGHHEHPRYKLTAL
jgi:hypothetical protein